MRNSRRNQHRLETDGVLFSSDAKKSFHGVAESLTEQDAFRHDVHAIVRRLPTNYVGNKKRVLWPIIRFLEKEKAEFSSVLDAFSGSGVVSVFFALMGKHITCNDLLSSSAIQAFCMLRGTQCPLTKDDWKFLLENKPQSGHSRFVHENYSDVDIHKNLHLFTVREADFLDRYRNNVDKRFGMVYQRHQMSGQTEITNEVKYWYALYTLIKHINDRCFVGGRYYSGQTIAKLEHRLQHEHNKGKELHETFAKTIDKLWFPPLPLLPHKVLNKDVFDVLKDESINADLLYLDPPYGGDSSDYAHLYRFLEELVHFRPHTYPEMEYLSKEGARFNDNKGYQEQFTDLLSHCDRFPNWLISFNATSFASLDSIKQIIAQFRNNVQIYSVNDFQYNYRKDRLQSTDCEYLILAKK